MKSQRVFALFSISLFTPYVFYRLVVFFREGKVSVLRELTGLTVHHYHYGVLLLTVTILLLLFTKLSDIHVIFAGLGVGLVLDSFLSSLFANSTRSAEVFQYVTLALPTFVLLCGVAGIAYILSRKKNS